MLIRTSSYASSKYGLLKVMEILAAEFPDVHVVTIHPGVVETNMLEKSEMAEQLPIDTRMSRILNFLVRFLGGISG